MKVLITGTGKFASHFLNGLDRTCPPGTHVTVAGRTDAYVNRFYNEFNRTDRTGRLLLETVCLDYYSEVVLTGLLRRVKPDLIICAHSHFSPAEKSDGTKWGEFLRRSPFGITLPLQITGLLPLCRAAKITGLDHIPLVNTCYPDVANSLATLMGYKVTTGLGNIHTLFSLVSARLKQDILLAGHHFHLTQPSSNSSDVVLLDGKSPSGPVAAALRFVRAMPREELNRAGAEAGGQLTGLLAAGERVIASLPGPLGLTGGYPVIAQGWRFELAGMPASIAEFSKMNEQMTELEGITLQPDSVSFHSGDMRFPAYPRHCNPVKFSDWDSFSHEIRALREELMNEKI
ncbi:hypothetical protein D9O29_22985 [Pantoea vagans]|uniref:Uncharacterized protein n=1 Tax=Pantoea vagans TaxID=470934 RepID=A0ABY3LA69_9GAMM|nr:hypothetical protein D9O29_22985 [Pantoea vagans]